MVAHETCRTCGSKLIQRETQKKPSQLQKVYYYTAYYFCPKCQKIYHNDKFKVINQTHTSSLFDEAGQKREKVDVEIWTDGACVFNGQERARAAWSFVSNDIGEAGLVLGAKQTNNVAEGLAIFYALDWAAKNNFKKIKIYSDSQITLHNLKKPAKNIKANKEIFQKIEDLIKQHNLAVYFEKVIGHSGDVNNERADRLANRLAGKE
jgi:ribonuclease HI